MNNRKPLGGINAKFDLRLRKLEQATTQQEQVFYAVVREAGLPDNSVTRASGISASIPKKSSRRQAPLVIIGGGRAAGARAALLCALRSWTTQQLRVSAFSQDVNGRSSWKCDLLDSVHRRSGVGDSCSSIDCQSGSSRLDYIHAHCDSRCGRDLELWPCCPLCLSQVVALLKAGGAGSEQT